VDGVCAKLRARLLRLAQALPNSRFGKAKLDEVVFADGTLALRADAGTTIALTELLRAAELEQIEDKFLLLPNVLKQRKYTRATHGAV
ncbi:aldehyde oxidase, partial [Bacillus thuringiensis]